MSSLSEWFTDTFSPHERHQHRLKKILVRTKTKFQTVVLAESYSFGRCLILDGEIQSAQADEFIYHESLVHPAMALHPKPQDVLILGGGEGATAREILRHPGVKRVTMVDIDGDVVGFCEKYLSDWHQGALTHRKIEVVIEDARKYMDETGEQFDIIISDLPTPADNGPVSRLYSKAFYSRVAARLKRGGIFALQAGSGSPPQIPFHAKLKKTLGGFFKVVRPYYAFVPSFGVPWAFLIATQRADPRALSSAAVDRRLVTIGRKLRFYDGETHEGLFRIPKNLRALLK